MGLSSLCTPRLWHDVYMVTGFEIVAPYTLGITFDDGVVKVIDFLPLLRGELYGPLRDRGVFEQVRLDGEAGNLVWPNGADFDPATLHNWDEVGEAMIEMARSWPQLPSDTRETVKQQRYAPLLLRRCR